MATLYVGQTEWSIELDTSVDLSSATVKKIKYRKPDKTEGELVAVLQADTTSLKYQNTTPSSDILDQEGMWTFWAYAEFASGTKIMGEPFKTYVETEGYI